MPKWFSDKSIGDMFGGSHWKAHSPAAKNNWKINEERFTAVDDLKPGPLLAGSAEDALMTIMIMMYSITFGRDGFTEEEISDYLENNSWEELTIKGLNMVSQLHKEIIERSD